MALHLTPKLLVATYDMLCTTQPFKRWRLPHSDEIEFGVWHIAGDTVAYHRYPDKLQPKLTRQIIFCATTKWTMSAFVATMAHEMVHVKQRLHESVHRQSRSHGPKFMRMAREVCRAHCYDIKEFVGPT